MNEKAVETKKPHIWDCALRQVQTFRLSLDGVRYAVTRTQRFLEAHHTISSTARIEIEYEFCIMDSDIDPKIKQKLEEMIELQYPIEVAK